MIKELILFTSYKACSGKNFVWGKNPFQYKNAIRLISVLIFFHVLQIGLLLLRTPVKSVGRIYCLVALGVLLFSPYLVEIIFSKKVLAKSIAEFKGTWIDKNAKLIAYSYFILNFTVVMIIVYVFS